MGDVINLRQARKQRARQDKDAEAARNRTAFGRSKADRQRDQSVTNLAERRLDGHRLTPLTPDDDGKTPA